MTRARGTTLAILVAVLAAAGWGTWAIHHAQQQAKAPLVLPGPQDPAQLRAAQAFIDHLTVPAAAQRDPYDSVCRVTTTYCVTSTTLTENDLVSQVAERVVAAGAKQNNLFGGCRVQSPDAINCTIRFDVDGARVEIRGGPAPYAAVLPSDVPEPRTPQGKALGPWSVADPLPAGWAPRATCEVTRDDGCHAYSNDPARAVVAGTLPVLATDAAQTLTSEGFVVSHGECLPAVNDRGACVVSGFRYRGLGGRDGESVGVTLRAAGETDAELEVSLAAR